MTVVTPANVLDLTGVDVDTATIAQARAIVELAVSTDLSDLDVFGAANRTWLSRAIAYQAAWLPSQVDLFSRADLTSVSQDGATYVTRDKASMTLAPLAQKALSRVSWARTRTVYVRPGRQAYLNGSRPVFRSYDDDGCGWVAL